MGVFSYPILVHRVSSLQEGPQPREVSRSKAHDQTSHSRVGAETSGAGVPTAPTPGLAGQKQPEPFASTLASPHTHCTCSHAGMSRGTKRSHTCTCTHPTASA